MLPKKHSKIFRRWLKIANIIPEKDTFGSFAVFVAVNVPNRSLPRGRSVLRVSGSALSSVAAAAPLPPLLPLGAI